ncbi:glycosyltransferase [Futiania mangrovi]|uniref:Glycosyltransferase n=1 Tax=Futiania mangrovi TaxID=2959716 RepID=A0A9J6PIN2_9PROT|nr:glycosyltransferase [Futiania mangrovii]MCP1337651.1 glycosyltransferase [Futiania mangrovii]
MTGPRHLLHVYATFAVGGPQVRFLSLAKAMGAGFRHSILAMDGDYACAARLDPALDVTLLKDVSVTKGDTLGNRRRFRAVLKEMRPDLLLTCNWGSIEWALANTPRLVPHLHFEDGFGPEEATGQIPRRVWMRRIALRGKTVLLPSHTLYRIARDIWRLPEDRLRLVPNGVDVARFPGTPAPELLAKMGDPAMGPLLGTIAALRPEKNLPRLVEAFAKVNAERPCRLAIAGEGRMREAAEETARKLGVGTRVFFTGYVADPASVVGAFDLFLLSSDTEQMPVSVLEAMASGLAVATTDVGDIAQMVAPQNRPYLVAKDAGALARSALALLADEALRARIGAANREKCERDYSLDAMVESWRTLWEGNV